MKFHQAELLFRDRMHAALDSYSPAARTALARRVVRQLQEAEANAAQAQILLEHIATWDGPGHGDGPRLVAAARKLEET